MAGYMRVWLTGVQQRQHGQNNKRTPLFSFSSSLPIFVCPSTCAGHSLGGALAVLATMDLAKQHPNSQFTLYTLGCPRVCWRASVPCILHQLHQLQPA